MAFIQGLPLCESFFFEAAKPILDRHFPGLRYSAGLLGYGSDVLGFDDEVSTDHMWGPRFYLFLDRQDAALKDGIFSALCRELPCTYKGYSVNFSAPDPNDNGVRHAQFIDRGPVSPLIFLSTFDEFLEEYLDCKDTGSLSAADWLSFSEHRLLAVTAGKLFHDDLGIYADKLAEAVSETLCGTALEGAPLIGSMSGAANFTVLSDDPAYRKKVAALYH